MFFNGSLRTTSQYSRNIANRVPESAMEDEVSLAYNNTSGIVLKLGNFLAYSSSGVHEMRYFKLFHHQRRVQIYIFI